MPLLLLALGVIGACFVLVRGRFQPTRPCRRCSGSGCPRCRFSGVRFRTSAHLAHRRK